MRETPSTTKPRGGQIVSDNAVAEKVVTLGTKCRRMNLSRETTPCPKCTTVSRRHSIGKRTLREIGISGPTVLEVTYSKHHCPTCRKHFSISMDHLAQPAGRFTNRVRHTAVALVVKDAMILEKASERMRLKYYVHVPPTTLHDWVVDEMYRDSLSSPLPAASK
jgi:transposase